MAKTESNWFGALFGIALLLLVSYNSWGAAANMYVTTTGAGGKSGANWADAMDLAAWETDYEGSAEAGDNYFIEEGTYTLTNNFATTQVGTDVAPISVIGVKSGTDAEPPVYSDWAFTTARPLIAAAGYACEFYDYWIMRNLQVTITYANGLRCGRDRSTIENCKATQSSGSSNRIALNIGRNFNRVVNSEGISTSGYSIYITNTQNTVLSNYAHDSAKGMYTAGGTQIIDGNIFDTITGDGIILSNGSHNFIGNNTFYACGVGINGGTGSYNNVVNNIFDECTAPASWSTEKKSNYFNYNSWDGDASSNVNITEGPNSIDSDITLTDAGNGDFTLPDSSAAEDTGLQVDTNTGVTGDYNTNMGADQTDTQAGGGGGGGVGGHISIY